MRGCPCELRWQQGHDYPACLTSTSNSLNQAKEELMLWTILVVLLILWLLGFSLHVGGGLIHILLVIAVVVLVINLISGRRTA